MNGRDAREWVRFDARDVPRLFAQDEVLERGWTTGFNVSVAPRTDEQLAEEIVALRNALRLPFCDRFLAFIDGEWERALEEASARIYQEPEVWRDVPVLI